MNPHFGGRSGKTISTHWVVSSHTSFYWASNFPRDVRRRQYRPRVPSNPF